MSSSVITVTAAGESQIRSAVFVAVVSTESQSSSSSVSADLWRPAIAGKEALRVVKIPGLLFCAHDGPEGPITRVQASDVTTLLYNVFVMSGSLKHVNVQCVDRLNE